MNAMRTTPATDRQYHISFCISPASVGTVSPGHPMLPSNPFLRSSGVMGGHPGFFYPPLHPLMGKPPPSSSSASLHHPHHSHPHPHHPGVHPLTHPLHGAAPAGGHSPGTSMLPPGAATHSAGKYDSQVRCYNTTLVQSYRSHFINH